VKADKLRDTVDGPEKFCTRCKEWWPADLEFFWSDPDGAASLFYCRKACYHEMDRRKGRRGAVQPATVAQPLVFAHCLGSLDFMLAGQADRRFTVIETDRQT
jgi:hypothetical protein